MEKDQAKLQTKSQVSKSNVQDYLINENSPFQNIDLSCNEKLLNKQSIAQDDLILLENSSENNNVELKRNALAIIKKFYAKKKINQIKIQKIVKKLI